MAGEDVIERLPFDVLLLDGSGEVLFLNRSAREVLDPRDGLMLRNRRLVSADVAQTSALRTLIDGAIAASQGDLQRPPGGPLALGSIARKTPLQVLVTLCLPRTP